MALDKAREIVAQFISTRGRIEGVLCIFLGVATVFAARGFPGKILRGFVVLHRRPFSLGDIIEVGNLKGRVIETGLRTTSLRTAENSLRVFSTSWFYGQAIDNKSRATTIVPYSLLCGQGFVNKFREPWHDSKILFKIDEIKKIPEMLEEITNMMKSNSNVYLGEGQPYCLLLGMESLCAVISIACNLKQGSEHELYLAKQDVLVQSAQIMRKHGATVGGGHMGNRRV